MAYDGVDNYVGDAMSVQTNGYIWTKLGEWW